MTAPSIIVALVSVLAGLLVQIVQSGGSIFGKQLVSTTWLPELVALTTFVGGFSAQLSGEPDPISTAGLEQALLAGLLALTSGAAPGLARFAHVVVPARVMEIKRAMRAAKQARESAGLKP